MDAKTLKVLLRDTPVSEVRYYSETGSTNDLALQWLESGTPDFALVAADSQTAGRGRMQRTWITNPGAALAFSLILHLDPEESKNAAIMPFIAGAGLSSALERLYSIRPQIKWPNDILLEGKKAAGILVESVWKDTSRVSVVIGIGVNISPGSLPPTEGMTLPATSIENVVGSPINRWSLMAGIISELHSWRFTVGNQLLMEYVSDHLAYKGEQVKILHNFGEELHGAVVGINKTGALLLETPAGITPIDIGDVQLRLLNN
jgi:BirA family biotin operon repressor/biotin-[acetyl-CoA-carboxylase] ligase